MMAKYEKEKLIGTGTYGNVWLVKAKLNKNSYVLKEVKLNLLNTSERQQAMREVTILAKCRHENIIKYKEARIEKGGILSIVMEYADGGDLHTAIANQKGIHFLEQRVISWFIQICLALQYIHFQNILHRDLKTQNIFLTRNKIIKVGDFGISRILRKQNDLATTAIGTPYYLSPEICQRKPYNYKSDIWALGCVLFEIVALQHPFQAQDFPHLITLILKGKPHEIPRHCSPLIKELIQMMLITKPEKRPSTDEILAIPALQTYLSEYMDIHYNKNSERLSAELKNGVNSRRHSLSDFLSNENETSKKRRASIACLNSTAAKVQLIAASKEKIISKNRSSSSSCSYSVKKCYKPSNLVNAENIGKQEKLTYKISSPKLPRISLKGDSSKSSSNSKTRVLMSEPMDCKKQTGTKRKLKEVQSVYHEESDYGYQSEETFKPFTESHPITKIRHSHASSKAPHEYVADKDSQIKDEVFPERHIQSNDVSHESILNTGFTENNCQHSHHCPECMLDMMWKNRIRGPSGVAVDNDNREKIVYKLQSVFRGDIFHEVYESLLLQWKGNETDPSRNSFKHIMKSLNYNQVLHLPLMVQLIQLDIFMKPNIDHDK